MNNQQLNLDLSFKIIIFGSTSELCVKFLHQIPEAKTLDLMTLKTIGLTGFLYPLQINEYKLRFQIYLSSPNPRFKIMSTMYMIGSSGGIFISIDSDSRVIDEVKDFNSRLKRESKSNLDKISPVPCILVSVNKNHNQISQSSIQQLAQELDFLYYELQFHDTENLIQLIHKLGVMILTRMQKYVDSLKY